MIPYNVARIGLNGSAIKSTAVHAKAPRDAINFAFPSEISTEFWMGSLALRKPKYIVFQLTNDLKDVQQKISGRFFIFGEKG